MHTSFGQLIAILTLALLAMASQAQDLDFDINPTPGQCAFTDQQLTLAQAIQNGKAKPVDAARAAGRLGLTISEMNQWMRAYRRLEALHVPDVRYSTDDKPWPVFVAIFDGTWNDKDDPDLPRTVPAQLADDLAILSRTDPWVDPHYYEGVGTRESALLRLWDGATGRGTVERAERALSDLKVATSANGGVVPYVYAIGFSRGAASARHFLNLADSLASSDRPVKSSALLFDTVATGQIDRLDLGIPASNDLTVQVIATREYRFAFPYVPVQTDAIDHPSLAYGHADEVVEVYVPGAHSDIGGGYNEGLWTLSLAISRALLARQGLASAREVPVSEAQAILNMGRHNSDWVKLINEAGHSRSSVAIKRKDRPKADIDASMHRQLDRFARVIRSAKRRSFSNGPALWFKIDRKNHDYVVTHNCQTHAFAIDAQVHAITLDGRLFEHLSESDWQTIDTGYGILLRIEPEDPANWTFDAVCSDARSPTPGC
jgi:hypothetical protein